jgi:hypothetical protein
MGFREYLYTPDTTNLWGGSIGTGVPFPTVKNRKKVLNINIIPHNKTRKPIVCNNRFIICGR